MAPGDHIFVVRPKGYTHHGIDCGDGMVIHFSGEPGKAKFEASVIRVTMEVFLSGGTLQVRRYGVRDDATTTLARAEEKLGSREYHLVANNCEHFVVWCCTGSSASEQVRAVVSGAAHSATAAATLVGTGGVVASIGIVQGVSGAGIMSGLASAGGVVGGGAAFGPAVLGIAPALLAVGITQAALRDDERLPEDQRAARADGRLAAPVAAGAATVGGIAVLSSAGAVSGLSAAGISSGLAAIGGGTMLTGAAVLVAAPAAAAAVLGFGVYKLSRRIRESRPKVALEETAVIE